MLGLFLLSSAVFFFQASAGAQGQHPQQPGGSSPQVATGVAGSANFPLRQFAADHDWLGLEKTVKNSTDPDTAFYRGLLFNRLGQYEESVRLLEPLLAGLAAGADRTREKQARIALANNDFRMFRYKQAAEQYGALKQCCAADLSESEKDAIELPAKILPLLQNAPPQTLELSESFTVPLARNAIDLRDVDVFVDGYPSRWIFDPAASFTVLSRSQAKRIGLKLAGGDTLTVRSITGTPIHVQAAVIPQLKFGAAFFRNVPAVIFDDEDLYSKARQYQVEGILAQPLLAALGAVTASDDDHLTILRQPPLSGGAPLFSDGKRLLVGAGPAGAQRLYAVDPGTTRSMLTSRYFDEHPVDFSGQTAKPMRLSGIGPEVSAYSAETFALDFGDTAATFHEIPVETKPGAGERKSLYGILGGDALDQLASYTFDFRSMRFIVRVHAGQ